MRTVRYSIESAIVFGSGPNTEFLVQIEIKPKLSLIPYHPCTHFIERRVYTETLIKFFRSKTQLAQTFVLWGLGGIG